ncbi:MAG: hypothetical protein OFPI_01300 [Osedax symbiont Rs2]|nr:MAG: hypothetical protein OFPI_01300 [Osedax symbiont Rs2]
MNNFQSDELPAIPAILQLAFRPFFLLSASYAIWLLTRWSLTLMGVWPWHSDIALFSWHAHEFQFGFAIAVVLGFLLTASQTWTGQPGIKGRGLLAVVALWLIARIGMNLNSYGLWFSLFGDSSLLLISAGVLLRMVLKSKNYKNLIFVPLLGIFLALHLAQIYAMFIDNTALSKQLGYATSWWFVLLISLISSRVIPFFISRATAANIGSEPLAFTLTTQLLILAIFLQTLLNYSAGYEILLGLSLCAHLYRLYKWHHRQIWANPMLWSLWLSYAFLPLALITLLADSGYANAMHLINVGFIASMIMAFTSRVSLGHTGREIVTSRLVLLAFICVISAALSRGLLMIWLPPYSQLLMSVAAILWLVALVSFVVNYLPILTQPRLDGRPG